MCHVTNISWDNMNKSLLTSVQELMTTQHTNTIKAQFGELISFIGGYL